jgi:TatA/E family protein of Tat protein translocase
MFENLSLGHLAVVILVFVIFFGPKRIPELAASLGGGIRTFKQSLQDGLQDGTRNGTPEGLSGATETRAVRSAPHETVPLEDARSASALPEGPKRLL